MADIFAGTQPPAWLTHLTEQKPGMLGDVIGELVGGLADSTELAIKKANDINAKGGETDANGNVVKTNWIKQLPSSIKPGLAEARLNADNPLWRIQAQQAQLNIAQGKLSLDSQQMKLDQQKSSMAQWEHDAPVLSKWMGLPYTEMLNTPIEGLQSKDALQIAERMKAAAARTAVNSTLNKVRTDFAQGLLGVTDAGVISRIQSIKPNPDGTPSPNQISELNKYRQANGMPVLGAKPPAKEPASVQLVNAIQAAQDEMDSAEASGDGDAYNRAKERHDLLLEQTKGQEIVTETTPEGGTRTIIGKGVSGRSSTAPTTATRTKVQQEQVKFENAVNGIDALQSKLTPEMVGVKGLVGEVVVDRGLSQLIPGAAVGSRIEGRTALRLIREGMLREVSESARFSAADREEIYSIFPSLGPGESFEDAMIKLNTVKGVIATKAIVNAKSVQGAVPEWAFKQATKDQIKQLFDAGTLTHQEAVDALVKYH